MACEWDDSIENKDSINVNFFAVMLRRAVARFGWYEFRHVLNKILWIFHYYISIHDLSKYFSKDEFYPSESGPTGLQRMGGQ